MHPVVSKSSDYCCFLSSSTHQIQSYLNTPRRRRLGSFACINRYFSWHGSKIDVSSGCTLLSKGHQ